MSAPTEPLTDDQRRDLRADLDALVTRLQAALRDEAGLADTVALDQSRMGRVSRIDAMQQQRMAQATQRRQELRLERVYAAIERYDDDPDAYGYCPACDEEIGYRRLKAFPDVVFCVRCADRYR